MKWEEVKAAFHFLIRRMNWEEIKAAFNAKSNTEVGLFKRCDNYLVKLELCKDTVTNANRQNVLDSRFAKFRASHLKVLQILDTYSGKNVDEIIHTWYYGEYKEKGKTIVYKVGSIVYPDSFEQDKDEVCAPGIHYFNTLFAAYEYGNRLFPRFLDCGSVLSCDEAFVTSFGFDNVVVFL